MGWLRALFGGARGGERALHRLLRERGASRGLRRFAEPFGADAERFWAALPRGTWALRAAARLGVSRGLVATALADLADEARERRSLQSEGGRKDGPPDPLSEPAHPRPGASDELLEQTQTLGQVFARERLDVDRFATEATSLLLAIIDADPSVRVVQARIEEAQRWGRLEEVLTAMDEHDAAYAERHATMARVVRKHIGGHELVLAIRGASAHPYR